MIHTSDSCGLKSDPAGRSAIRCELLPPKSGLLDAGSAVALTLAVTTASCAPAPAELFLSAVMISLASILPPGVHYAYGLARYFHRFQHCVDYLANLDAFHLEIRPQQHAVLQYRGRQRLYVLGRHEIALLESRERPRRRQ
jgi:hypothetical protein